MLKTAEEIAKRIQNVQKIDFSPTRFGISFVYRGILGESEIILPDVDSVDATTIAQANIDYLSLL